MAYAVSPLSDVTPLSDAAGLEPPEPPALSGLPDTPGPPDLPDLAVVWTAVRDEIELPRPSVLERLLVRLGLPQGEAMLVAAAPALRGSWICAVALSVAFAVGGGLAARTGNVTMFLTVAPLVPVLAVATAFGPEASAALEQESAAPYPLVRLVLLRTGAVLLAALPVVLVGQLVFPEAAAWVWLLPALGFIAAVLALSTWFGPWRPATAITGPLGRRHRRGQPARHHLGGLRAALCRRLSPHARRRTACAGPSGAAPRHHRKDLVMTSTHSAGPAGSTTVSLRGVTKRYRSVAALDAVDLDLGPGITGLLGPNGAGKTTMLRVMATVLRPDDGQVRLLGRDPGEPGPRTEVRRRLGYQPQELGFPRGFSTMAFVNYMAVLKEWADRDLRTSEVRRVLELVGLGDVATKRISRLSGGQRRRVALAQALLGTPELLVLDEPTTGLDPEQRASLRGVLADIAATSTMVISTHQTEDVAALCSRVVVLDAGRVHFDGTVPELVSVAAGKVWMAASPDAAAQASWRTASGRYRNVGEHVPSGAELVEPSLEDAYLLLRGAAGLVNTSSSDADTSAEVA